MLPPELVHLFPDGLRILPPIREHRQVITRTTLLRTDEHLTARCCGLKPRLNDLLRERQKVQELRREITLSVKGWNLAVVPVERPEVELL